MSRRFFPRLNRSSGDTVASSDSSRSAMDGNSFRPVLRTVVEDENIQPLVGQRLSTRVEVDSFSPNGTARKEKGVEFDINLGTIVTLQRDVQQLLQQVQAQQSQIQQVQRDNQQLQCDNQQLQRDNQELQRDNQELRQQVQQLRQHVQGQAQRIESLERRVETLSRINVNTIDPELGRMRSRLHNNQNIPRVERKFLQSCIGRMERDLLHLAYAENDDGQEVNDDEQDAGDDGQDANDDDRVG